MRVDMLAGVVVLAVACRPSVQVGSPVGDAATATMRSSSGATLGVLSLRPATGGMSITGTLTGLPAGLHGIHLHAVGKCEPTGFTTAGAHINLAARHHGLENPQGPHEGDLPNIEANSAGSATVDLLTARVAVSTLLDADGSAVVIHATADDQKTDPAGNSGSRIACGIVERAAASSR